MRTSLQGSQSKNPLVRALFALIGLVLVIGLVAGLILIALPLAIGAVVIGGLAAVLLPGLRRRRNPSPSPSSAPLPRRQPGQMKSVEPDAPPRTLGRSEVDEHVD
ncbi:hypothetical protein N9Z12_05245 [Opitutaceae bacterium]|nr:hypothetical protein [Opitutaceae bacterium]